MQLRNTVQLLCLSVWALAAGGCVFNVPFNFPTRSEKMICETLVPARKAFTTARILQISIDGAISDDAVDNGFFNEPSTVVRLKDVLQQAEKDSSVRGILLRINSPGGGVTASDLLYRELTEFKKKTKKKIVVLFMDTAASGGYYAAMAGDRIFAHPTTVTGSIGVVAMFPNFAGLSSKVGVGMRVVKSGPMKDIGSLWRDFSGEETAVLQNMIDTLYARFVQIVVAGRPRLDTATVRKLADGRIYTAEQARENGLIDDIGYLEDAFAAARELADIEDAALVTYRYSGDYKGNFYAQAPGAARAHQAAPQVNLLNLDLGGLLSPVGGPFYYLWLP